MQIQHISRVILDPVKEADIVAKYRNDSGWTCVSMETTSITFENQSPPFITNPNYIMSFEENHKSVHPRSDGLDWKYE